MAHASWILAAALTLAAGGPAAGSAGGAAKPVGWAKFADCAALYRVNARLGLADRPAQMTAQMSEVGNDYAKAAVARYVQQRKTSPVAAQHAVDARIKAGLERLAGHPPRAAVEKQIDKCPQVDG